MGRYFKITDDNYILGIGIGSVGTEIGLEEYNKIRQITDEQSAIKDGLSFRIRIDFSVERFEYVVPVIEENASTQDYIEALNQLGVDVHEGE